MLSLIGATTFWFFNALNKNYDARISYPIEFQFDRDSVVIMKPLQSTVSIDVSSGGWNLFRKTFWFNVTPVQVPLENPTEIGFYTRASLQPLVSDQLSELKINYLVTDTVYIDVEQKKSRWVKLYVDTLEVDLAENHRMISAVSIDPDTVKLIGPASFIDTLGMDFKLHIPTRGITNTYNRDVEIQLGGGKLTSSIPLETRVKFEVEKFERQSIEIAIEMESFPQDSSVVLSNKTVQVFYTIASSNKEEFTQSDFAITADMKMMDKSDSTVMVILVYHPEEAIEIEVIPENIKIKNARR